MDHDGYFSAWRGMFPRNNLIAQLDADHPFNLAESTTQDLTYGELIALAGPDRLNDLRLGYGSPSGLPVLREAVAGMCGVDPAAVLTTQGVALGLFLLAFELCRPGDEAVIAAPCFPPSRNALQSCGVELRQVRQSFDDGYALDFDELARVLNPRTRLVSLANPANPSGVRLSNDDLGRVLDFMRQRSPDAYLFVDESYREATYNGHPPESAAALGDRVIVGASVSKAYGAPGLRVGWLIVNDEALRERLTVAKTNLVISCPALNETLAAALVERRDLVLKPRRAHLAAGLAMLERWIGMERRRVEWVRPDAGALCCIRLGARHFCDASVARFWAGLPSRELQLSSGAWFGESDRIFRLGFGYLPLDRLGQALEALSGALDRTEPARV